MQPNTAPVEQKTTRRRKVQAVLAGGTVLGIGALVTLASWNDSEFAEGIFGAGEFNLQGSTTGATEGFLDHDGEDDNPAAASLNFEANNMVPEQTVYAPFWVRLDDDTTVSGTIEAEGGISIPEDQAEGSNIENLSYTVFADPETCSVDEGATGGDQVAQADTLDEGSGSTSSINLDADGTAVQLCFVVEADDESFVQGDTTEVTWEILATSNDS